ncbi:hypothetical protein D4764_12G0007220, partial [Takifugu flavidus]
MAANANLTGLSRRHGVKVGAGSVLSVEEVADVMFLQETHSDGDIEADYKKEVSRSRMGGRAFSYQAPLLWNQLPVQAKAAGVQKHDQHDLLSSPLSSPLLSPLLSSPLHSILYLSSPLSSLSTQPAISSFFVGLQKKRGQNRVIHSLFSGTGQELVEAVQIKKCAVEFFSFLYANKYCEDDDLFAEFCRELPQVSEETNSRLDRPLQLDELHYALHGMQGRRAPGADGLTVEFYRAFWDIVAHDMLEVFNESMPSGKSSWGLSEPQGPGSSGTAGRARHSRSLGTSGPAARSDGEASVVRRGPPLEWQWSRRWRENGVSVFVRL